MKGLQSEKEKEFKWKDNEKDEERGRREVKEEDQ